MARHSFIQMSKLSNVKGRISYIECDMVRAIHQQRLLKFGTSEYNTSFGAFVKEHFPLSWSIAEKMSDDEIKAMIDSWRKSVK